MSVGKTKTSVKLMCNLPDPVVNKITCTSMCGITSWGTTAFVLKSKVDDSNSKKKPITIIKISKFNTTPKVTTITVKKNGKSAGNIATHANSICYARKEGDSKGSLYITTKNPKDKVQVIKMNTSGVIEKELYRYTTKGEKAAVGTLTFYGTINGKMYFICPSGTNDNRVRYKLLEFTGDKFVDVKTLFYGAETENSNYIRNDITYKDGKFYHCYYKKDSKGISKYNRIYVYDIHDFFSLNGQVIEPIEMLYLEAPKDYNKGFEIEGITIYQGGLYIVGNMGSTIASKNKDGLFKMSRK